MAHQVEESQRQVEGLQATIAALKDDHAAKMNEASASLHTSKSQFEADLAEAHKKIEAVNTSTETSGEAEAAALALRRDVDELRIQLEDAVRDRDFFEERVQEAERDLSTQR